MDNIFAASEAGQNSPFRMASVTGIYEDGVTLKFASESEAGQKRYMLFDGCALKTGDQVLCARVAGNSGKNGTWIVMSAVVKNVVETWADYAGVAIGVQNQPDLKRLRLYVDPSRVMISHPDYGYIKLSREV